MRVFRTWRLCLSVLIGSVGVQSAWAQDAGRVGKPDRAAPKAAAKADGVHVIIPALDVERLAREDEGREAAGLPPRFAVAHPVRMTPSTHGEWRDRDPQTRTWQLRIASPGAVSLNLGFTRYVMPETGTLVVRSADGTRRIRPFTSRDNAAHGELWTPPIGSDDIIVEVTIAGAEAGLLDLTLGSINVGYRRFGDVLSQAEAEMAEPRSGSCNVDVACSVADPWRLQVASVGVISTGGSTFCTGFMVNNAAQDLTPYFMTANHCGIASGNAASLVVFWNYENSTCRGVPGGGGVGNGTLDDFQTGSFFRAGFATSDFTLVELDELPDPEWNVSFAGWDRTGANPPSGACIHHPNTDEKRITFYDVAQRPDRPTHSSSWGCSPFPGPGDNTHIKAYWWLGVTEPGSSGSPLFDNNMRVIGQLHGGESACGQTGDALSDCYGRFSRSWTGGGSNATRLSNWLDPGNTGLTAIDTISGGGMTVAPATGVVHIGPVGGPFTNPSVVYTLTNPTPTPIDYSVSLTANFGILLDGGTSPVVGTLAGSGGMTTVTVSLGAAIDALGAGIYDETLVFDDVTNARSTTRQHTVDVGQTDFDTDPANSLVTGGPVGGPFTGTQVYTLTSTRPTPVSIEVSASDSWISINGVTGPVVVILSGTGDSENVTIGISSTANSLSAGLYNGAVSFSNQSGGDGDTSRGVTLDVGRFTYASTDTPQPIADFSTTTSIITVADNYCIGDVNVEIDITHTYIGDLTVDLQSPAGTVVRLHNHTGGSADNIVKTYDDGVVNPDGPGTLADFNGESVMGVWTLSVSDTVGQDTGALNSWSLKIASSGSTNCPSRELVHSFPLDANPGWTTAGAWAYGVPQGLSGDPSAGFTGPRVYGYNLSGAYPNNMGSTQYLRTTAIDCTDLVNTQLRFRRWLGVESSDYDHANIQVSSNGINWTTVWNHAGATLVESAWSQQVINIAAVADDKPTVFIRWGMGPTDGSVTYQGWNIDDVEIWAIVPSPCEGIMPADANLDSSLNALDVQPFVRIVTDPGSASELEVCAADVLVDEQVDMNDVEPFADALLAAP